MAETGLYVHPLWPGLLGVDLPWVEVKNTRPALGRVDTIQRPTRKVVGEKPKPSATTAIDIASPQRHGSNGDFQESAASSLKGKTWRIGYTVQVMADGYDTGAVGVASLRQFVPGPGFTCADRIAGSAITLHLFTTLMLMIYDVVWFVYFSRSTTNGLQNVEDSTT